MVSLAVSPVANVQVVKGERHVNDSRNSRAQWLGEHILQPVTPQHSPFWCLRRCDVPPDPGLATHTRSASLKMKVFFTRSLGMTTSYSSGIPSVLSLARLFAGSLLSSSTGSLSVIFGGVALRISIPSFVAIPHLRLTSCRPPMCQGVHLPPSHAPTSQGGIEESSVNWATLDKAERDKYLHGPDLGLAMRLGNVELLFLDGDVEYIVTVDCD